MKIAGGHFGEPPPWAIRYLFTVSPRAAVDTGQVIKSRKVPLSPKRNPTRLCPLSNTDRWKESRALFNREILKNGWMHLRTQLNNA